MTKACRRRWKRARRRKGIGIETITENMYRGAKKELCRAIKEAKNKAWSKLLSTIDEDPWGRPYKIVMNKLRAPAKPICETLQPEVVKDIVDKLFPRGNKVKKYIQEDPSGDSGGGADATPEEDKK